MIHWHCHELFTRMPAAATAGAIAVVIDVLRASTTMITALANGADRVVPVAAVEDARRVAAGFGGDVLLGGERGGIRIPGFDAGNSPLEYPIDRVRGRVVVITTTNGTAALHACAGAREVLVGAIVNRTAVGRAVRRLAIAGQHVHLVCAGTDGVVSAEDVLAAGAIVDAATRAPDAEGDELDAAANAARQAFRALAENRRDSLPAALVRAFVSSPGGANLEAIGMGDDLAECARIDCVDSVPRLDHETSSLRIA